jgi:hypothetical protein
MKMSKFWMLVLLVLSACCPITHAEMTAWIEKGNESNENTTLFIDFGVPVELNDTHMSQSQMDYLKSSNISQLTPVLALIYTISGRNISLSGGNVSGKDFIELLPNTIESSKLLWQIVESSRSEEHANNNETELIDPSNGKPYPHVHHNGGIYYP